MDVAQRLQELRAFDGDLHCKTRLIRLHITRWRCPDVMEMPGGRERRRGD
jgi:hypothetical protein